MQQELDLDAPIGEARVHELHEGGRAMRPARVRQDSNRSTERTKAKPERAQSRRREHAGEPQGREPHGRDGGIVDQPGRRNKGPAGRNGERLKKTSGPTESVYVANIPWEATEIEISDLFARHGEVRQTTIIRNRSNGRSKGFAFVDMPRPAARIAVGALHGADFGGRELTVRVAKPRRS
jgi:RNA recognition motif-containing protein